MLARGEFGDEQPKLLQGYAQVQVVASEGLNVFGRDYGLIHHNAIVAHSTYECQRGGPVVNVTEAE